MSDANRRLQYQEANMLGANSSQRVKTNDFHVLVTLYDHWAITRNGKLDRWNALSEYRGPPYREELDSFVCRALFPSFSGKQRRRIRYAQILTDPLAPSISTLRAFGTVAVRYYPPATMCVQGSRASMETRSKLCRTLRRNSDSVAPPLMLCVCMCVYVRVRSAT